MSVLVKVKEVKGKDEYTPNSGQFAGKPMYGQYMTAVDENGREYPLKINAVKEDRWKPGDKFLAVITDSVWNFGGENYNKAQAKKPDDGGGHQSRGNGHAQSSGNGYAKPDPMPENVALGLLISKKKKAAIATLVATLGMTEEQAEAKFREDMTNRTAYLDWSGGIGTTLFLGMQKGEIAPSIPGAEIPPSQVQAESEIPF